MDEAYSKDAQPYTAGGGGLIRSEDGQPYTADGLELFGGWAPLYSGWMRAFWKEESRFQQMAFCPSAKEASFSQLIAATSSKDRKRTTVGYKSNLFRPEFS